MATEGGGCSRPSQEQRKALGTAMGPLGDKAVGGKIPPPSASRHCEIYTTLMLHSVKTEAPPGATGHSRAVASRMRSSGNRACVTAKTAGSAPRRQQKLRQKSRAGGPGGQAWPAPPTDFPRALGPMPPLPPPPRRLAPGRQAQGPTSRRIHSPRGQLAPKGSQPGRRRRCSSSASRIVQSGHACSREAVRQCGRELHTPP